MQTPLPSPPLPHCLTSSCSEQPLNFIDKRRGTHRAREKNCAGGDLCWLKGNTHFYGQFGFYVNLLLLPSVNMYRAIQAVAHSQFQYQYPETEMNPAPPPCPPPSSSFLVKSRTLKMGVAGPTTFSVLSDWLQRFAEGRRRWGGVREIKTAETMTATRCCDNCQQQQHQHQSLLLLLF